jgi:hypothetical protein
MQLSIASIFHAYADIFTELVGEGELLVQVILFG